MPECLKDNTSDLVSYKFLTWRGLRGVIFRKGARLANIL